MKDGGETQKIIIYQLLPRLLNKNNTNRPNGSLEENGCGKMNGVTCSILRKIKSLGVTHVWYTGLLEHATQTNYSAYGIACDNASVVKGKAGSPYAIKDYYDIDPDLAVKPADRMQEFENLLERTHKAGLRFIMDFVPNHVARQYHSDARPLGVKDLGDDDDASRAFSAQNNFYYIPGEAFHSPVETEMPYEENPAKATGNDNFSPFPGRDDWYETVKLNYGVDYVNGRTSHFQPIPDTWKKMTDILLFWAQKGVDGFRCDMAEMVPVEFWNWAITKVHDLYPDLVFIAEVYNPGDYRRYVEMGHFDYLYDKVGLYDTLRDVTCGRKSAAAITSCWQGLGDLQPHMLNFLENHDEQRIASDFFAGSGVKGRAALVVSCCMNANPFMVYAGQELGERGMDAEGFSGCDGRTTIFDYWSVPTLYRYFYQSEDKLQPDEKVLRVFYQQILKLANSEKAIRKGCFFDLMYANYDHPQTFDACKQYAFFRKWEDELLLFCANFDNTFHSVEINIPKHAFVYLGIPSGRYAAKNLLTGEESFICFQPDHAVQVSIGAYSGTIIKVKLSPEKLEYNS